MASPGLEYYDSRNKVETDLLTTFYRSELAYGQDANGRLWRKYTRIRTKTYSYVGLKKETCRQCALEKYTKYNKTIGVWDWNRASYSWVYYTAPQDMRELQTANVQASNTGGELWSCTVQVNETVEVYASTLPTGGIAALFQSTYGDWDYDED